MNISLPSTRLRVAEATASLKARSEFTAEMAALLVTCDAWRNKSDAMRVLLHARTPEGLPRFRSFEIARYLDDARQAAMQTVVAAEMSK